MMKKVIPSLPVFLTNICIWKLAHSFVARHGSLVFHTTPAEKQFGRENSKNAYQPITPKDLVNRRKHVLAVEPVVEQFFTNESKGQQQEEVLVEQEKSSHRLVSLGTNNVPLFEIIFSSFMNGDDDILLDEYVDEYIEYTDTSLYKSVYGKHALMKKLEDDGVSFFHHNRTIQPYHDYQIRDILVSMERKNKQLAKLSIVYTQNNISDAVVLEEKGKMFFGIITMDIVNQKIKSYFNVKQEMVNSFSEIDRMWTENNSLNDLRNFKYYSTSLSDDCYAVDDIISKYFATRNVQSDSVGTDRFDTIANKSLSLPDTLQQILEGSTKVPSLNSSNSTQYDNKMTFILDDIISSSNLSEDQDQKSIVVVWNILRNNEMVGLSRGCSYFKLIPDGKGNLKIDRAINVLESDKVEQSEAHSLRTIITPEIQNKIRDSGLGRVIADSLVKISVPSLALENPIAISNFIDLSRRTKQIPYGDHRCQIIDLILPKNMEMVKGIAMFVHGGAWGSGERWMYRLASTTFLEEQMAVAIIGYRTFPDGNVRDQISDIRSAYSTLTSKFPELFKRPDHLTSKEWIGKMLIGHSSGAHISLMLITEEIESHLSNHREDDPMFDKLISLSPVTSISKHFVFEAGRGVEEISPMKPACYSTRDSFDICSPTERMLKLKDAANRSDSIATKMLFVHGLKDDTVPFTSTQSFVKALREVMPTVRYKEYYPDIEHVDAVTDLMLGGQTKNLIREWLLEISNAMYYF